MATYAPVTQRLARYRAFQKGPSAQKLYDAGAGPSRVELEAKLQQVLAAYQEARAALGTYTSKLTTSVSDARSASRILQAWSNDYGSAIAQAAQQNPDGAVPDQMALAMSPSDAQALLRALYSDATVGIGLYENGTMFLEMDQGRWSAAEIARDLDHRLQVCKTLVGTYEDGSMGRAFQAKAALNGLGEPVSLTTALIILGVVLIVAYFLATTARDLFESWGRQAEFKRICQDAERRGDTDTTQRCLSTVANIPDPDAGAKNAIWAGAAALGLYLVVTYGIPAIMRAREETRR